MKTYLTKSRSSLLILVALVALPSWAKPVAQVTEIEGQVFVITSEGKTHSLKLNDHLDEKSEVMVEEGGTVTLNDYYDATYHLIGGSHLKFFNKSVQLKRGKTWIQSKNPKHELALTTANGHVNFWKAEFITTFDQSNCRSQVLVVNGDVEVANVLDRNMKYTVTAGTFTLVDPEVENGIPRSPTKVGLASLNSSLREFKKLPTQMKNPEAAAADRSIASVSEAAPVKKGEIIFISTNRMPASVGGKAHEYFRNNLKKSKAGIVNAPIKFYGVPKSMAQAPVEVLRTPASVPNMVKMPVKAVKTLSVDQEFSESLKGHEHEQPKYSNELDSLILDLKSY